MTDNILRLPEVKARTGLSRSTIYAGMLAGTFPDSVPLGLRAVGWPESRISRWIDERIAAAPGAEQEAS